MDVMELPFNVNNFGNAENMVLYEEYDVNSHGHTKYST